MENDIEIIDLTESYTYCRARVPVNPSIVIDLQDDNISYNPSSTTATSAAPAPSAPASTPDLIVIDEDLPEVGLSSIKMKNAFAQTSPARTKQKFYFGDCSICHEPLGTRPMAATNCGHVYCFPCIEKSVKFVKKCPMCRKSLPGAKSYHLLFF